MQSVIDKLTNNIVVAAFVPSLIFCTVFLLIFETQIQLTMITNIIDIFQELGLFVIFAAFTISLFLVYLRGLLYEFYRGRYFPKKFNYVEKKRAKKLQERIDNLQKQRASQPSEVLPRPNDELYNLVAKYQAEFPANELISATKLGNILAAAESCIAKRYSLDSVTLWSILIQVLPQKSYQQIDNAFNQMSLLINSSVLSLTLCVLCTISAGINLISQSFWQREHIVISIISLILSYVFYLGALPIAKDYAKMYCSAFDLYRFEILKQMYQKFPQDTDEELQTWEKLSEFLAVGREFTPLFFDYKYESIPETDQKSAHQ